MWCDVMRIEVRSSNRYWRERESVCVCLCVCRSKWRGETEGYAKHQVCSPLITPSLNRYPVPNPFPGRRKQRMTNGHPDRTPFVCCMPNSPNFPNTEKPKQPVARGVSAKKRPRILNAAARCPGPCPFMPKDVEEMRQTQKTWLAGAGAAKENNEDAPVPLVEIPCPCSLLPDLPPGQPAHRNVYG